jgi:hypothetical protein
LKQRYDGMRAALAATLVFSGVGACASGDAPGAPMRAMQVSSTDGRLSEDGWSEGSVPLATARQRLCTASQPLGAPDAAAHAEDTDARNPDEAAADAGAPSGPASDAAAPPSNDCCTPSSSGGCSDGALQACVCEGDAFCCTVEYDALCARQATSRCGLDCDARPPVSDCCSPSDVPGCTQPAALACICDIDPFCCVSRFDASCVNLGIARCSAACGAEGAQP